MSSLPEASRVSALWRRQLASSSTSRAPRAAEPGSVPRPLSRPVLPQGPVYPVCVAPSVTASHPPRCCHLETPVDRRPFRRIGRLASEQANAPAVRQRRSSMVVSRHLLPATFRTWTLPREARVQFSLSRMVWAAPIPPRSPPPSVAARGYRQTEHQKRSDDQMQDKGGRQGPPKHPALIPNVIPHRDLCGMKYWRHQASIPPMSKSSRRLHSWSPQNKKSGGRCQSIK